MLSIGDTRPLVGRFAPSPTGPLHFGSLVAALGSYLLARQVGGRWLLRIEDLDPPRVVPGSAGGILKLLERLGFEWDGEIVYQSRRFECYRQALQQLTEQGLVFECSCSRRELVASAPHTGEDGPVYPGTCRKGPAGTRQEKALRLLVPDQPFGCHDRIFGLVQQDLQRELGDFILRRADGLYAYQLAVVVDDIDAGVTQVVRGADLLSSTPRQIYLYQCLQQPPPEYYHLPLALGSDLQKLSKRHGRSGVISIENGSVALWHALDFLGQSPPMELFGSTPRELLAWGLSHFTAGNISSEARSAPVLND